MGIIKKQLTVRSKLQSFNEIITKFVTEVIKRPVNRSAIDSAKAAVRVRSAHEGILQVTGHQYESVIKRSALNLFYLKNKNTAFNLTTGKCVFCWG